MTFSREKTSDLICFFTFLGVTATPLGLHLLGTNTINTDLLENRKLTQPPKFDLNDIYSYPKDLDQYLNDHFPLRNYIISTTNRARTRFLKASSETVIAGESHWLFYSGDQIIEDLSGKLKLSELELDQWTENTTDKQNWLQQNDIGYLFLSIPNKSSVYTEKLPWWVRLNRNKTRLEQLKEHLATNTQLNFHDSSREIERLKKSNIPSYWSDDTHWSGHLFRDVALSILEQSKSVITDLDLELFSKQVSITNVQTPGDLSKLSGFSNDWPADKRLTLTVKKPTDLKKTSSPIQSLPRFLKLPKQHWGYPQVYERSSGSGTVIVFHDSFLQAAISTPNNESCFPLALPFKRCISIWMPADFDLIKEVVKCEKPDMVIEQRVERYLFK